VEKKKIATENDGTE
jgi:hypothetical protein